jgi:Raf kinase inhibitor-like YbhB/YbcL family protein
MPDTNFDLRRPERTGSSAEELLVSSPSFSNGGAMPVRSAVHGGNYSPAISWSDPPKGTASLAVTLEDVHGPDGGPFTLWILYNIPAARSTIPEGLSKTAYPSQVPGAEQGVNDTGEVGYDGPSPPHGHPDHRYVFQVYALTSALSLPQGATRRQFHDAIAGRVMATGTLLGTFRR